MTQTLFPLTVVLIPWALALIGYGWYETFSFSPGSKKRRYRYQLRFNGSDEYETRGSGYFYSPTLSTVQMIPEYGDQPHRRILDSRTNEVLYEAGEEVE